MGAFQVAGSEVGQASHLKVIVLRLVRESTMCGNVCRGPKSFGDLTFPATESGDGDHQVIGADDVLKCGRPGQVEPSALTFWLPSLNVMTY